MNNAKKLQNRLQERANEIIGDVANSIRVEVERDVALDVFMFHISAMLRQIMDEGVLIDMPDGNIRMMSFALNPEFKEKVTYTRHQLSFSGSIPDASMDVDALLEKFREELLRTRDAGEGYDVEVHPTPK